MPGASLAGLGVRDGLPTNGSPGAPQSEEHEPRGESSPPRPSRRFPHAPRSAHSLPPRWTLTAGLSLLAGLAALALGGALLVVLGALLVAGSCALIGWRLGEDRRLALQGEVDERIEDLRRALSELEIAQTETVRRLSMAVEFRDEDTGAHIERIGRFSALLAQQIGLGPELCRRLSHSAPLHDVGKVAIPDAILLKEGPLTPEERSIVETHAEEGHRLLRGSSSSILDMGATIALSHHERWDGGGYPRGLSGEQIPIEGRIVAIADVFDALTSNRVYRKAFTVERATEMMLEESATHFDPTLLAAFMEVLASTDAGGRARGRSDHATLVSAARDAYTDAIRRGNAEDAEAAIAAAIEDGLDAGALQEEVTGPAMLRIEELLASGEVGPDVEHHAADITRRVLATMNRYMLARGE